MKIKRRAGFTMVEMVVVFMVMSVFIGVSVPPIQAYYENTGYKDVQNRAETVFYAAQQTVTSMTLSSQIEPFFQGVKTVAFPVDDVLFPHLGLTDDSASETRYYAIRYNKSDLTNPTTEGQLVLDLLQNLIAEKDMFNASITIEVDSHTYTIQTVFYSLENVTFNYGSGSGINLVNRTNETLKQLKLGMAEANVSFKVLALETNVLQEPFIASDIELVNPVSGVVDGDDEGDDDEWWEDDPTDEEDPPGDGGDSGVIMDPSKSYSVYITLSQEEKIRSLRIHWLSPSENDKTIVKYELWYEKNGSWKKKTNTKNKIEDEGNLVTLQKNLNLNNTMKLRIDIPKQKAQYCIYEITVYTQESNGPNKWIIAPITVTISPND